MKTKILHYLLSSALFITGVVASEELSNREGVRPNAQHMVVSEQEEEISSLADSSTTSAAQNQEELEVSAFAVDEEPAPAAQNGLDNTRSASAQGDEGVTQINASSTAQYKSQVTDFFPGNITMIILDYISNQKKNHLSLFTKITLIEKHAKEQPISEGILHSTLKNMFFPKQTEMNLTINQFEAIHSVHMRYLGGNNRATRKAEVIRNAAATTEGITSIILTDDNHTGKKEGLKKISNTIGLTGSYPNINTIVFQGILRSSLDMNLVKDLVKKDRLRDIKAVFAEKEERSITVKGDPEFKNSDSRKNYDKTIYNELPTDRQLTLTSRSFRSLPPQAREHLKPLTIVNVDGATPLVLSDLRELNKFNPLTLVDFMGFRLSLITINGPYIDIGDENMAYLVDRDFPFHRFKVKFIYSVPNICPFKANGIPLI